MSDHKALNLAHLTFKCKVPVLDPYSVLIGHGVFNIFNEVLKDLWCL